MSKYMIDKNDAVLVAIDFQEKLMPVIKDGETVCEAAARLVKGTKVLDVPILVTQQYTKGLGGTIEPVVSALGEFEHIEKFTFDSCKTKEFQDALQATGRKTVIICGAEAHICVQQTALELLENGYKVFVIADCIGSRTDFNCETALRRMAAAGAVITTYESALYEMLGSSKADGFKEISNIVK